MLTRTTQTIRRRGGNEGGIAHGNIERAHSRSSREYPSLYESILCCLIVFIGGRVGDQYKDQKLETTDAIWGVIFSYNGMSNSCMNGEFRGSIAKSSDAPTFSGLGIA